METTKGDVVGWVLEGADGTRWAVKAGTKEDAMRIFTSTAPPDSSVVDEHTIPRNDAGSYELEAGKAVAQKRGA